MGILKKYIVDPFMEGYNEDREKERKKAEKKARKKTAKQLGYDVVPLQSAEREIDYGFIKKGKPQSFLSPSDPVVILLSRYTVKINLLIEQAEKYAGEIFPKLDIYRLNDSDKLKQIMREHPNYIYLEMNSDGRDWINGQIYIPDGQFQDMTLNIWKAIDVTSGGIFQTVYSGLLIAADKENGRYSLKKVIHVDHCDHQKRVVYKRPKSRN